MNYIIGTIEIVIVVMLIIIIIIIIAIAVTGVAVVAIVVLVIIIVKVENTNVVKTIPLDSRLLSNLKAQSTLVSSITHCGLRCMRQEALQNAP